MSLVRFYQDVAPVLLGRVSPEAGARTLGLKGKDAARLSIYARFCRRHRFEVLEKTFEHCRAALIRDRGEPEWERLVESYFERHPMRHVELNTNGAEWPDFLAQQPDLPRWLAALADFEWWEWQTLAAPDGEPSDPERGPLRFAPVIELRPYAYDLVGWIEDELGGAPDEQATFVLFWRDQELGLRRENVDEAELAVLKCIASGVPLPAGSREVVEDLRAAGALHGR